MNKISFYSEILKVDKEQRIVEGYASTEAIDSDGEVIKKEAILRALDNYMKFANVREMHQPSAVGVTLNAEMTERGLRIAAKIIDDMAWKKVLAGVYKGFSIGGRALRRNVDYPNIIEDMELIEISVVDRPANPEAVFECFKMSDLNKGDTMTTENQQKIDEEKKAEEAKKQADAEAQKSDQEMSEEEKNKQAEADKQKACGDKEKSDDIDDDEMDEEEKKKKADAEKAQAEAEAQKAAKVQSNGDFISKFSRVEELLKADFDRKLSDELSKAQLVHKQDVETLQKAHKEELEKFSKEKQEVVQELEKSQKRVKELEAQPAPTKGVLKSVDKGQETSNTVASSGAGSEPKDPLDAIKKAHQSGGFKIFQ